MHTVNGILYYKLHRKFSNENFLYIYTECDIRGVEFIVGDEFLMFCDQTFIKTCPVLDVFEVVTASILERIVRIVEEIMV